MAPRPVKTDWLRKRIKYSCVKKGFSTSKIAAKPSVDSITALRNIIDDPDGPQKLVPAGLRVQRNSPYAQRGSTTPPIPGRRTKELRRMMEMQQRDELSSSSTPDHILKLLKEQALEKYQTRRWNTGEVYAPKDLGSAEMKRNSQWSPPKVDVFDMLAMNPLKEYKNFAIMSEYMTPMGRIKHSKDTGLRPVNQRKIAKAIRRSIGLGLMPSVHAHPEVLDKISEKYRKLDERYIG